MELDLLSDFENVDNMSEVEDTKSNEKDFANTIKGLRSHNDSGAFSHSKQTSSQIEEFMDNNNENKVLEPNGLSESTEIVSKKMSKRLSQKMDSLMGMMPFMIHTAISDAISDRRVVPETHKIMGTLYVVFGTERERHRVWNVD